MERVADKNLHQLISCKTLRVIASLSLVHVCGFLRKVRADSSRR